MLDPTKTTLPKKWAIEFTMALRSRDVTGAAIGDALRQAEAFCADSGQSPDDAFGPADAYADSLTDLPTVSGGQTLTTRLAPNALGLFGLLLALPTFDAWRAGRAVEFPIGGLITLAVVLAAVAALLLQPRIYRRRGSLLVLLSFAFLGATAAQAFLRQPIGSLPVLPCAVVATAALIGSGLWQMRVLDPDLIVDPLAPPPRPSRGFYLLTCWLMPIGTVLALGIAMFAPVR
jgi:hypothetical protein